jgi:ribosomal protein L11 methyltransferase
MSASPITHRAARTWHKIRVRVDSRMTEAISAFLFDLAITGLEITSPQYESTERAGPSAVETIIAYIPVDPGEPGNRAAAEKTAALQQFLKRVRPVFPDGPLPVLETETIMEEDWSETWKRSFTSLHITPRLVVKPTWEDAPEPGKEGGPGKAVIEIDPGLAFGTGHHASTQLALLLVDEIFLKKKGALKQVLDVGTGSGILALGCALLGARKVLALDNDPDAVATAKKNIRLNQLGDRITVSGREAASVVNAGFDLVLANITHDILAGLAETLTRLINPRGFLILSGILAGDQENSIVALYGRKGVVPIKRRAHDEWAALLFQKVK